MGYSGAWGKLIYEKTLSRKSRGTVPLIKKILEPFTLRPSPTLWRIVFSLVLFLLLVIVPLVLRVPDRVVRGNGQKLGIALPRTFLCTPEAFTYRC
jgi:hypothetical protein